MTLWYRPAMRSLLHVMTLTTFAFIAGCGGEGSNSSDAAALDSNTSDAAAFDSNSSDAAAFDSSVSVIDANEAPDAQNPAPQLLSQTGLYQDIGAKVIAADVQEFSVAHPLWTDGAAKRRWVWLPPGSQIDTTDMNHWEFPVGTKLWKEFVRDGILVETRFLMKTEPTGADWFAMAYVWEVGEADAVATPLGLENARGTEHDVPGVAFCVWCHAGVKDYSIGFSAIELDHSLGGLTLDGLKSAGTLNVPPDGNAPFFPIPGDANTVAALGYLHGNCGNCHNEQSSTQSAVALSLRLDVDKLNDVNATLTYQTAVDVVNERNMPNATHIISSGVPGTSALYLRIAARDIYTMPPAGTELLDNPGLTVIQTWIEGL